MSVILNLLTKGKNRRVPRNNLKHITEKRIEIDAPPSLATLPKTRKYYDPKSRAEAKTLCWKPVEAKFSSKALAGAGRGRLSGGLWCGFPGGGWVRGSGLWGGAPHLGV